jgi:hypothetical protein
MAVLCSCDTGGGNLGRPSCYETFKVAKKLIFVEYYKPDGTVNGIQLSTLTGGVLDQTYLDARVKDVNPRTRWYPTPELKNVVNERADDITETFEDTTSNFIQEGARTFEGMALKGDPAFVGKMKQWRCLTSGVFVIDKNGNLRGSFKRAGYLDPIKLQDDSLSASLMTATDTTGEKTRIRYTVDSLEDDADLRMIETSSITADIKGVSGLVDVTGTASNIATTGFDVQLNTPYGGITSPIPAEGMALADFEANEITPTPGAIAITSVTESVTVPGFYTFVFTVAQTSGDVIRISNPAVGPLSKSFDLNFFDVTIP